MEKLNKQDLGKTAGGVIEGFENGETGTFKVYVDLHNKYYPDKVPVNMNSDAIKEFKYNNDAEKAVAYTAASNFNKDIASGEYRVLPRDRAAMDKDIENLNKALGI